MNDITVEVTITLATLSTTLFSEYIGPTKYVKTALGIHDWIKRTPAAKPFKLRNLINPNPIKGPMITLTAPKIDAWVHDTTFNLDKAIPKDIKTKNIVAYVSKNVVFSKYPGTPFKI